VLRQIAALQSIRSQISAFSTLLAALALLNGGLFVTDAAHATEAIALGKMKKSLLTLSLTGPQGTTYEGTCRLTTEGHEEDMDMTGSVPEDRSFEGEALTCDLKVDGRLTVEARKADGNVTRTTTSGGRVRFSIR